MMKRRTFLKSLAAAGLCAGNPLFLPSASGAPIDPYRGKFFITITAEGGWDVTSFCDPKSDPTINHWGSSSSIQTISNSPITYAPFAYNSSFFATHHENMLVINGVDCQTNAHEAGTRHTWSGQIGHGFPTFSALAAATLGPNLPLAYLSNGGYKETAGITKYTLMQDPTSLSKLVFPNRFLDYDPDGGWDAPKQYHRTEALSLIQQAKLDRMARLQGNAQLSPKQTVSINDLLDARVGAEQLAPLADTMPDELVDSLDADGQWNPLLRQAQIALASYEAGLTVSADLILWGFDTHSNHDTEQANAIQMLQRGINYLWEEAVRRGIDDKLVILIGSDFGRTPLYNDGDGKDHWPINSSIIMSKGESWTNKVVGITNDAHEALAINSQSLAQEDSGIILKPKHVQQAMRQLAGIENHELCQQFDLDAENVNFFG